MANPVLIDPLARYVLTWEFGGPHKGRDYAAPLGTDVFGCMAGRVIKAGWNNDGYGNLVVIEAGEWKLYLAHLSEILVGVGDMVGPHQVIGKVGSTGNSSGPHVHFELRRKNVAVDPRPYLAAVEVVVPQNVSLGQYVMRLRSLGVRVRAEPNTGAAVWGVIPAGVVVCGIELREIDGNTWVRLGEGMWSAVKYAGIVNLEVLG